MLDEQLADHETWLTRPRSAGPRLAAGCLALLAGDRAAVRADVEIADVRGPGHGLPSAEGAAAAGLAMRTEGLMVDPVYTAKALSLLASRPGTGPVVFWHTGGLLDVVAEAKGAR